MPPKKTVKKEPAKKEVVKKENFDHLKTEYDDLPCPIPYTNVSYAENPELRKARPDRLTSKDLNSIRKARQYFCLEKMVTITYAEYLSLQAADKLPGNFRIRLLRLYGGKGNLHWR